MFVKSDIFLIEPLRDRVFKRELCGEFVRKVTSFVLSDFGKSREEGIRKRSKEET